MLFVQFVWSGAPQEGEEIKISTALARDLCQTACLSFVYF